MNSSFVCTHSSWQTRHANGKNNFEHMHLIFRHSQGVAKKKRHSIRISFVYSTLEKWMHHQVRETWSAKQHLNESLCTESVHHQILYTWAITMEFWDYVCNWKKPARWMQVLVCHWERGNLRTASPSSRRFLLLASRTRALRFCEEPKIGSGCTLRNQTT